jgi:hypothetical protein
MKKIALTKGKVALVDDIDFAWLGQWKWSYVNSGYAVRGRRHNGRNHMLLMHREFLVRMGVELSDEDYGDHINHDRLDNRRSNLRAATPTQSNCNLPTTNKHGYRGIVYHPFCYRGSKRYERKKPWQSRISVPGRKRPLSLGYYATSEEAARAYDEAAKKHHGEYATLNFAA